MRRVHELDYKVPALREDQPILSLWNLLMLPYCVFWHTSSLGFQNRVESYRQQANTQGEHSQEKAFGIALCLTDGLFVAADQAVEDGHNI